MKLIRYGTFGNEKPGIYVDNNRYDVSQYVSDYDENFFEAGGIDKLRQLVGKVPLKAISSSERWASPIARPSKIICIGLNYADHAAETNAAPPKEPIIFFKATSALAGPYDNIVIPKGSAKTDWEVELAVVIGKKASYVSEQEAIGHIAGYCLHNDYSEREFQLERGGQWVKGKSCDTFAPLGPWLATTDEISDVDNLRLWLNVNGKQMQNGNTKHFIFKIPFLISYLSQFMSLLPGDVISTGTPAGVGLGQKPNPVYLKENDVIELGIDGLGCSKQIAKRFDIGNVIASH